MTGVGRPAKDAQRLVELVDERGVAPGVFKGGLQLQARRDQRLGDESATEAPEVPGGVGTGHRVPHHVAARAEKERRAASTNSATRSGSFTPGDDSTPEATSTPHTS